jgi:hypothetical protein
MSEKSKRQRRGDSFSPRRINTRELKQRFLIVCEGERTEPNYFRQFRVPKNVVALDVVGFGYNTVSLVEKAISLSRQEEYDQVWCVMDRDSFPAQDFNNAFQIASANNIRIAYSNEAFELWYLLHFHYYNTAISRADYTTKLTGLLGKRYAKNSNDMYELLLSRQDAAIKNAARLLEIYNPSYPENDNPSTTVHLLVFELRKYSS